MRANSSCPPQPCRFGIGAAGIVTSLVVCALLTGCSAQAVVSTTVPAATATTRPVPRVLVTSVPVIACPTTFGVSLPTIRLPAFAAIAVPADLANRLAFYSDTPRDHEAHRSEGLELQGELWRRRTRGN